MIKKILPLILMLLLFLSVSSAEAQCWEGTVVEVIDGNTLIVNRKQTRSTIRLYGIDAPATTQAFASEAKKTLQNLVLNKKITACLKKTRAGQAYEVHVLKGFMLNVNRKMVGEGLAWSTSDSYKKLQESARKKHRGLWADDNPVSPRQYLKKAAVQQRVGGPHGAPANSKGSLNVYKARGTPQPAHDTDNATQALAPEVIEQRQQELETIRKEEQERINDTSLSLTDIDDFSMQALYRAADYEYDGFLEISFDYRNTALDSPVDWDDGEVNCDCRVTGHFSEGTSTRIARTSVILSSYQDRVYIDIPSSYFEESFIDLNSCSIECRISAGIFDLKATDKVYFSFNYRRWLYPRRHQ